MQARTRKKRLEYLNKALEAEPENVDAQLMQIQCTCDSKPDEQLPELYDLMKKAEKQLEREGFFKNDVGDFWLVLETRPYMRVCFSRFEALIDCGMLHRAIDQGRRLLELCETDNLGVRYALMHLYACVEDEMHALALVKQFDGYEETQMLLPLAMLYYKMNQFNKAQEYIRRLAAVNKDTKKFLRLAAKEDMAGLQMASGQFGFLFASSPYFFKWALSYLRSEAAAKRKK